MKGTPQPREKKTNGQREDEPNQPNPGSKHHCGLDPCFVDWKFPTTDSCIYAMSLLDDRLCCDYSMEGYYAFTWCPNPSYYTTLSPIGQFASVIPLLTRQIRCISDYWFSPEITKQGNIHIHGMFKIADKIKFYGFWLPAIKRYGYTLVKDRVDCKWVEYIFKDQKMMREMLIPNSLPASIWHGNDDEWKQWKTPRLRYTLRLHPGRRRRYRNRYINEFI